VISHPVKVATPADAVVESPPVHDSVPPPEGWLLMDKVTEAVELVTVLFELSSTVTTGCVAQAVPLLLPPGWVVNTTFAAGPETMKLLEVSLVRPVAAAVRV
jgi:hypothetical protein